MLSKDSLYWIWLAEAIGTANRDVRHLLGICSSPYELFRMSDEEIDRIPEIGKRTREGLFDKSLARAANIVAQCEQQGIEILTYCDPRYPYALHEIKTPPVLLYYKGTLPDFGKCLSIGLVGTRRMSEYGMKCAYRISYGLASAGVVTVSGMAGGIDGVCAAASLRSGGVTVAVLGCGLDIAYPRQHQALMREIEAQGVVMTEYPPGTPPTSYHFPVRNRLISGLTQATVVVEAGPKSGSLITAREAVTQGRVLFAVPVSIRTGTEGTNRLLVEGARVASTADDILEYFSFSYADARQASENRQKTREIDYDYLARMGVIDRKAAAISGNVAEKVTAFEVQTNPNPVPPTLEASNEATPTLLAKEVSTSKAKSCVPGKCTSVLDLSLLEPLPREILSTMPDDCAVTVDALNGINASCSEIIAALTTLEILGAIQKLPGALYIKI